MGAILTFLGTILGKVLGDKVLGWVAMKGLMIFLFVTIVPLVLNNFLYDIIQIVMNFASGQASGAGALNGSMTFTGFGAWLMECFRLSEALSVLISALCLRVVLSMIPFVRLVG
jgi:hypothetical protein